MITRATNVAFRKIPRGSPMKIRFARLLAVSVSLCLASAAGAAPAAATASSAAEIGVSWKSGLPVRMAPMKVSSGRAAMPRNIMLWLITTNITALPAGISAVAIESLPLDGVSGGRRTSGNTCGTTTVRR